MSFWSGLGKVALGVGCIVCAPVAVGVVATTAATFGATAIGVGLATDATVIGSAVTAMEVAEGSMCTLGSGIAAKGVSEAID